MPILEEVALYLETNTALTLGATTGTLQFSIITDAMADTVVVLYESAGGPTALAFSTGSSGAARVYEQPSVQALSRSATYATARANAGVVYDALDGLSNTTMTGSTGTNVTYLSVDAVQPPFPLGRDDQERHLISVNFNCKRATT